VFYKMNIRS